VSFGGTIRRIPVVPDRRKKQLPPWLGLFTSSTPMIRALYRRAATPITRVNFTAPPVRVQKVSPNAHQSSPVKGTPTHHRTLADGQRARCCPAATINLRNHATGHVAAAERGPRLTPPTRRSQRPRLQADEAKRPSRKDRIGEPISRPRKTWTLVDVNTIANENLRLCCLPYAAHQSPRADAHSRVDRCQPLGQGRLPY